MITIYRFNHIAKGHLWAKVYKTLEYQYNRVQHLNIYFTQCQAHGIDYTRTHWRKPPITLDLMESCGMPVLSIYVCFQLCCWHNQWSLPTAEPFVICHCHETFSAADLTSAGAYHISKSDSACLCQTNKIKWLFHTPDLCHLWFFCVATDSNTWPIKTLIMRASLISALSKTKFVQWNLCNCLQNIAKL